VARLMSVWLRLVVWVLHTDSMSGGGGVLNASICIWTTCLMLLLACNACVSYFWTRSGVANWLWLPEMSGMLGYMGNMLGVLSLCL
jgi:hypothetical protein